MALDNPKDGMPGTTTQSPRWEGPQENTPRGYMRAKDIPTRAAMPWEKAIAILRSSTSRTP